MYLVPMMWTSVRPAGGGSAGGFCAEVSGRDSGEPLSVAVASFVGAASVGVGESDVSSTGGVDEATVSVDDGDAVLESLDVAATCARTGLTMANPITTV